MSGLSKRIKVDKQTIQRDLFDTIEQLDDFNESKEWWHYFIEMQRRVEKKIIEFGETIPIKRLPPNKKYLEDLFAYWDADADSSPSMKTWFIDKLMETGDCDSLTGGFILERDLHINVITTRWLYNQDPPVYFWYYMQGHGWRITKEKTAEEWDIDLKLSLSPYESRKRNVGREDIDIGEYFNSLTVKEIVKLFEEANKENLVSVYSKAMKSMICSFGADLYIMDLDDKTKNSVIKNHELPKLQLNKVSQLYMNHFK